MPFFISSFETRNVHDSRRQDKHFSRFVGDAEVWGTVGLFYIFSKLGPSAEIVGRVQDRAFLAHRGGNGFLLGKMPHSHS
jgi:hypothetical protein